MLTGTAQGQMPVASPVYLDDSPRAAAVLSGLKDLGPDRNLEDAARAVQARLNEEPRRVLPSAADGAVFVTVRDRLNEALLENKELLEKYREVFEPISRAALSGSEIARAEESYLLTAAGYEAVLRRAQNHLESAQFASAILTLEQLDRHPDRAGERALDAITLLEQASGYLRDGGLKMRAIERLARWRAEARAPARGAVPTEHPTIPVVRSPFDAAEPSEMEGLLPKPLWSDYTGEGMTGIPVNDQRASRQIPPDAQLLYTVPTVVGDIVYVNDAQTISAWNRFTLSLLWRVRVDAGRLNANAFVRDLLEEVIGLASDGETVVALTGIPAQFDRGSSRRALIGLDALSGRVLWTRTIEDFGEESLMESMLSGPPLIDEGVTVLTAVKQVPARRLNSSYLIGVDTRTGQLAWATQLGSIGALPYGTRSLAGDTALVRDGVTFRCDRIGFCAAVETASGRLRWLRRMDTETFGAGGGGSAWETAAPVWYEGRLFVLSPDRREIVMLDPDTGAVLARETASRWSNPKYLLAAAGRLIGVADSDLFAKDLAAFGSTDSPNMILTVEQPGIRGRVVVSGGQLVAPTAQGMLLIGATDAPGTPPTEVPLDSPGMVLPLPGQLVVVDDVRVHTYLLWDTAEKMLRERMTAEPENPMPAVTFAELSYRADKPAGILPALDHALKAIDASGAGDRAEQGRSRLFRSVLEMVEPGRGAPLGARLDNVSREALIDRLGRAASLPMEKVAYSMAAGRFYEGTDQPQRAVDAYQTVLRSKELSSTTFTLGETTVPADDEAAARLRRVVREHGREVYAAYEAEAEQRFAMASASLTPEPFEAVAKEFPVARVAARAWSEAATRYESQGKPQLAVWALEEGLRLSREALERDDPLAGELGGRLVMQLERAGRLYAAVAALEQLRLENPSVVLTDQGRGLNSADLLDDFRARLARGERRARIGTTISAGQELAGVTLARPDDPRAPAPPPDRVMMVAGDSSLSMWKNVNGEMTKLWDGVRNEAYLRQMNGGVFLAKAIDEKTERDVVFLRRDAETGEITWSTQGVRRMIRGRWEDSPERVDLPMIAGVDIDELVWAFEDNTLVIATTDGGVIAFDTNTGKALWRERKALDRVHELTLFAGTLVLGGVENIAAGAGGERVVEIDTAPGSPVIVALDARTGQSIQRMPLRSELRWLVATPEGELVAGVQGGLMMIDVFRARVKWQAQSKELAESTFAVAAPGRVVVSGDDDLLWQVDTTTGKLKPQDALETRERLLVGHGWLESKTMGDVLVFGTRRGLLLFDRAGQLVGTDTGTSDQSILAPAFAQDFIVTMQMIGEPAGEGFNAYEMSLWSTDSCKAVTSVRVEGGEQNTPQRIEVIDGKILVSFAGVTRVLNAPAK